MNVTARRVNNRVAGAAVGVAMIATLLGLPAGTAGVVRSSVDAVASVAQATLGDAAANPKTRTWATTGRAPGRAPRRGQEKEHADLGDAHLGAARRGGAPVTSDRR